jgi:hypothetical protein
MSAMVRFIAASFRIPKLAEEMAFALLPIAMVEVKRERSSTLVATCYRILEDAVYASTLNPEFKAKIITIPNLGTFVRGDLAAYSHLKNDPYGVDPESDGNSIAFSVK